jgi:hypothetical protein
MNYNSGMKLLLAAFFLAAGPVRAADPKPDAAATAIVPADKTTLDLVKYLLKADMADVDPKLIDPFLAVKLETLPKQLQRKAEMKQIEIRTLIKLHNTKKKGMFVPPTNDDCSEKDLVKPMSQLGLYPSPGFEEVTEDQLKYVMDNTKCTEVDLGCRFSLLIFYEKKKDRILKFASSDPIMGIVAASKSGGGGSHLFGSGLSCLH